MSVGALIRLALGLLKLVNWITARIDQAEWQRLGYDKALAETLVEFNHNLGVADTAVKTANEATPKERKDILEGDI